MNDRPQVPSSSTLSAEPPVRADDAERRDDEGEGEVDKYDVSTLACTD